METVNVSALKNNPSESLRKSHSGVVVVMNRDKPEALMVGLEHARVLDAHGVRPALATALFKDGHLSLGRGAALAGQTVAEFVSHLSRLGIPVISLSSEDTARDLDTLDEWLAGS